MLCINIHKYKYIFRFLPCNKYELNNFNFNLEAIFSPSLATNVISTKVKIPIY